MTRRRCGGRAVGVLPAAAAAVLALALAQPAVAQPAPGGSDRAAAVQAVLDRVLGPGGAVVQVDAQTQTSSGTRTQVRYGSAVAAAGAVSSTQVGGTTVTSVQQQDLVGSTTTTTSTPAGALIRQTVTVVVDRARLAGVSLASLRALVSAAAGVVPAHGDRVLVLPATPHVTPAAAAPQPLAVQPAQLAVPALWGAGGVAALGALVLLLRRRRPAA